MANKNAKLKQLKEKRESIKNYMQRLDISEKEAEELWKFDNEELENEEVNKIEQKEQEQKEEKKKKNSPIAKVKTMKAKKKVDESKQKILDTVFDFIMNNDIIIKPEQITNTKISFQDTQGNFYSISVTKHKEKPTGYKGE